MRIARRQSPPARISRLRHTHGYGISQTTITLISFPRCTGRMRMQKERPWGLPTVFQVRNIVLLSLCARVQIPGLIMPSPPPQGSHNEQNGRMYKHKN
jgi:hypothetical protein